MERPKKMKLLNPRGESSYLLRKTAVCLFSEDEEMKPAAAAAIAASEN